MELGKTSSAGASYNLYYSRTRASCTCSRCGGGGGGGGGGGLSSIISPSLLSLSLSLGDGPIYTEILSQRAVKPKTTNQPTYEKICCDPSLELSL